MGNIRKGAKLNCSSKNFWLAKFHKNFYTKSYAKEWMKHTENALKSNVTPDYSVQSMTLYDLLDRYDERVVSQVRELNSLKNMPCRLTSACNIAI